MRTGWAVGAAVLLAAASAAAAPAKKGGKQVVNFDGDQIDGDLMRPEGDLFSVRPELALPSLVVPPRSFERASKRTIEAAADALAPAPRTSDKGGTHR